MKTVLKDFGKSLSLANVLFLRVWSELVTYSNSDAHFMKDQPAPVHYFALITNILLVAIVICAAISYARREVSGRALKVGQAAFLFTLLIFANAVREVASKWMPYLRGPLFKRIGSSGVLIVGFSAVLIAGLILLRWPKRVAAIGIALIMLLQPFIPITVFNAAERILTYNPKKYQDSPTESFLAAQPGRPRVIWAIFDEMDQRLSFIDRPASVDLPNFDRLRREALYASNAFPPAGDTIVSMPSLITGRPVHDYEPAGMHDAMLAITGERLPARFSSMKTAFSEARTAGFNTALVGWYIPYCRILASELTRCFWCDMPMQYNSTGSEFPEILVNQLRSLVETSLLSPFGQSLSTKRRIENFRALSAAAFSAATDERIGMTLLHFQPPHGPHSYSRVEGRFTLGNSPIAGYLDSLALADRTLGDLRKALESARLWDRTTLLVSADHWYRASMALDGKRDQRVPFILKLAGQREPIVYTTTFNTLGSSKLLLAVLRGDITDAAGAARWLDAHPSYNTRPYIYDDTSIGPDPVALLRRHKD